MDIEKIYVQPQPYSRPLWTIARIIAERESDEEYIEQIKRFLERSGVPGRDRPA